MNAGRIDGVLYGIMPFCRVEGILVPKGAWEATGRKNSSMGELSALYELLEPEKRSGAVASTPFLLHEIARSWDDNEEEIAFSSERFTDLFDFFARMEASVKDYTGALSDPVLFMAPRGWLFAVGILKNPAERRSRGFRRSGVPG